MFGPILKSLRIQEGLSQDELAQLLGVSKSSIGMYEQGKRKPKSDELLKKIASHFGVTIDYLMDYSASKNYIYGEDFEKYNLRFVATKKFPMIGKISCGEPIMCEREYETFIEASSDIVADFCVTAKGDSMINARILDGDVVFVRAQDIVENGEIAAVIVNDEEITLKRFYYYPESERIVLQAENPKYEPMIFDGESLKHIRILGKAVSFMSNL